MNKAVKHLGPVLKSSANRKNGPTTRLHPKDSCAEKSDLYEMGNVTLSPGWFMQGHEVRYEELDRRVTKSTTAD